MEEGPKATRRSVLRHGLYALGALAGFVGVTGLAERARSSAIAVPLPATSGSQSLRLVGTDWHLTAPGLRRGDLPQRGDVVTVSGVLSAAVSGEQVGTFLSSVVHLDVPSGHGPYSPAQLETHTFQLSDGTLIGIGTTTAQGESAFSIVGGSGKFHGITGSYTARQSPLETGGDGTAEFTMTLNTGR